MSIDFDKPALQRTLWDWVATVRSVLRDTVSADDLLHHSSIMAVATVVSGGFNYLYQLFMGRALGPEQFGVFGALFALFYLTTVLGRGIRFSATRFCAEFGRDGEGVRQFYRGLLTRTLAVNLAVFGVLLAASPFIASFLGLDSPWTVAFVTLTVPAGLTLTANQGMLQGRQAFGLLGGYKVLQSGLKLGLGVALVVLGFGIYGAFAGIILGALVVLVLTTVHIRRRLPPADSGAAAFEYGRAYRFVPPAILAGFCITVPGTVDVLVVKHVFTDQQAGLYTAVSVLGKILIFLPLGITHALFPKVSDGHVGADTERMRGLLARGMVYSGSVSAAGAGLYWLAPKRVLSLFFGPAYVEAAPVLRWYGVAVTVFVLALVTLNFQLARDRTRFVYGFTVLSLVEVAALFLFHASLQQVVFVLGGANCALLVYGVLGVRGDKL